MPKESSSNTSIPDWQTLFQDWQDQQLNTTQQFFDTFGQWQKNLMPDSDAPSSQSDTDQLYSNMQALNNSSKAFFDSIAQQYEPSADNGAHQFLFKSFSDMTKPENWLNLSGDLFNMGAHKLSEKPFVSGISDIEERLAYVNDSWQTLITENQQYHGVVMNSWLSAYGKFLDSVKAEQAHNEDKVFSPRELIDLWSKIANQELMTLHRSEHFLTAQKEMIKASMQYRLHEKNIAEIFCESLHIPTRVEVDELHQSVTELKRELRKTKQRLQQLEATQKKPAKRKPSTRKTKPSQ